MKTRIIKIAMIFGILIINLFMCSFFQIVLSASPTGITTDDLEKTVSSDTPDLLQKAAANSSSAFYNFDPTKVVSQNKKINIYGGSYDNYQYNAKSVICTSPGDHEQAATQKIICVMDISSEGVTVYKYSKNADNKYKIVTTPSDTTDSDKKKAIKYAKQLAYFAYMATKTGEDTTPANFASYKSMMRFYVFGAHFDSFKLLGVPSSLDPSVSENPNLSKAANNFYKNAKSDLEDETADGNTYTARFVFLYGYTSTGSSLGQNDCIYSGKEIQQTGKIKIVKRDEDAERLKGAKFNIYHVYTENGKTKTKKLNSNELTTNEKGVITYKTGLVVGEKYKIVETAAPSGYELSDPNSKTITLEEGTNTVKFTDPKSTGNLKIKKVDMDSASTNLSGFSFKLKNSDGEYVIAVKSSNQTKVTGNIFLTSTDYTTDVNNATEFVTDANGNIGIYHLDIGTYQVIETSVGNNTNYQLNDSYRNWTGTHGSGTGRTATIKVNRQEPSNTVESNSASYNYGDTLTVKNQKQTGNLKIVKKDADSGTAMKNVSFKLIAPNGQYVIAVKNGNQTKVTGNIFLTSTAYTTNINSATEFVTDANGNIGIYNLLVGTYQVVETSVGDNSGYEVDDNYITWTGNQGSGTSRTATIKVNRQSSVNTVESNSLSYNYGDTITVTNRRKYVSLSGKVWLDNINTNKVSDRDGLYKANTNDLLLKGITVQLVHENNGAKTKQVVTDANGYYKFEKIEIDDLKYYKVVFTYNGMSYEPVAPNLNVTNGSKATESTTDRTAFHNSYATIMNTQGAREEGTSNQKTLKYQTSDYKSTLLFGDINNYNYGNENYKEGRGPVSGVDTQYIMQASTYNAYGGNVNKIMSEDTIRKQNKTEIDNINLGIQKREMPDVSVVQDVEKAVVSLNGYSHTYNYSARFSKLNKQIEEFIKAHPDDGQVFNVGVNFVEKDDDTKYTQTIYSSDIVYDKETEGENLGVTITYQVILRNDTSSVYTKINELSNYFDQDYEWEDEGDILIQDEDGKIIPYTIDNTYNGTDGYKKIIIKPENGINLVCNSNKILTITYKLKNEAILKILNQDKTLESITEVVSYSSYSDSGFSKVYAGVDQDSNPNNATIGKEETYEDDTSRAPSLILNSNNTRIIKGTVWQDEAIEELLAKNGIEKQRIGNGQYDEETEDVIQNVKVELLKVNEDNTLQSAILYQTTSGLIETTANQESWSNKESREANVVTATVNTDEAGGYSFVGIIPGKYVIRFTYGNESVLYDTNGNQLETLQKAEGGVEYYKSTLYRTTADSSGTIDTTAYNKLENNLYWYADETQDAIRLSDAKDEQSLVEERTSVEEITYQSATDASKIDSISSETNQFEIRMDYSEEDLNNTSKDTQSYGQQLKFVFDNIDFGIIRRPKQPLELEKEISYIEVTLANGQEIIKGDPRNETLKHVQFLEDGRIHLELDNEIIQGATLKISYAITVDNTNCEIDYNDTNYYYFGQSSSNENWKIATVTDLFDYPSNELTFNKEEGNNSIWEWEILDITKLEEGRLSDGLGEILRQNYTTILHTTVFNDMQPGTVKVGEMTLSKLLTTDTTQEFVYDNDLEINTYNGRKIDYTTPGNYDPTNSQTSEADDDTVDMTITGPTGEDRNYIPYIIIGIIAFVVLGVGIIIIKRKIIR